MPSGPRPSITSCRIVRGSPTWAASSSGAGTIGTLPATLFDADFDGFLWGPLAGLRFELTPHVDFFVEYQFHIWGGQVSDENVPNSPNWDYGHLVTLGLIYRLR